MRIVSRRKLREFWIAHSDSERPLRAWFATVKNAAWRSPNDIKAEFPKASIVADNRVVFDISGGKYRVVVKFHYNTGVAFIRFIGTHREYDRTDVTQV